MDEAAAIVRVDTCHAEHHWKRVEDDCHVRWKALGVLKEASGCLARPGELREQERSSGTREPSGGLSDLAFWFHQVAEGLTYNLSCRILRKQSDLISQRAIRAHHSALQVDQRSHHKAAIPWA